MHFPFVKIKRLISLLLIASTFTMMPSKASATCPYRYVMGILAAAAIAGPYMKPIWKELDETTKIDVKLVLGSAIFAATMTGSAYLLHSCNTKNVAEEEQ